MVFFIGGVQPRAKILGNLDRCCSVCGHTGIQLKRVDHYISVFFVPVIRIKKGNPFYFCRNCNAVVDSEGKTISFGKDSKERKCPYCGERISSDYTYCPFCGKRI